MANNMTLNGVKARDNQVSAKDLAKAKFKDLIKGSVSAQYIGFTKAPVVAAVTGLEFDSPVVTVVLQLPEINDLLSSIFQSKKSVSEEVLFYEEDFL